MKNQIKLGSLIAYLNVFLNMFVSVFLTPFLLQCLGEAEYGVYKIIQSFAGQLGIMSFGVSALITRNVVFYNTKQQKKEKENFLFMAYVITFSLALLIGVVGAGLYFCIEPMYAAKMTAEELLIAQKLFVLLVINTGLSVVCDSFMGLLRAHEKFVISNGIGTLRFALRLATILILLNLGVNSVGIVVADLLVTSLALAISFVYGRFGLREKAKFYYWDGALLRTSFAFSAAVFLQAIINQVNQNVDNVILGAMEGPSVVTVYSIGLTLYTCFISMVTVVGGMYGPQATRLVAQGAGGEALTDFAIKPARIQAMIALLGIVGFVLLGQDFVQLWLGDGYEEVYWITLILIIPVLIPLVESITNSILDAMLKRMARSLILLAMCAFNIVLSILLVTWVGYIGAAIGTATSLVLGHGILMNIYLKKKIKINVFRLFKGVFKGTLLCAIVTGLVCVPVIFIPDGLGWFVLKGGIVVCVYALCMLLFGMNKAEKQAVFATARRVAQKLKLVRKEGL